MPTFGNTSIGSLTDFEEPNIGAGVAGKTIHLFVDGTEVATAVTETDGSYSINFVWDTQGDYAYHVTYEGD
jgi:hypothetical protein